VAFETVGGECGSPPSFWRHVPAAVSKTTK
jgi:hypothetical protein